MYLSFLNDFKGQCCFASLQPKAVDVKRGIMKKICVYKGDGVGGLSIRALLKALKAFVLDKDYVIETIKSHHLMEPDTLKDCALLIFPGGRDVPFDRALRGQGNKNIKKYVKAGGRFLGICAGAYYGAKKVIFEPNKQYEVIEDRELAFFPGAAVGAIYNEIPFSYKGLHSAHVATIRYQKTDIDTFYNGGCYFENAKNFSPNVKILAYYMNAEVKKAPAIVLCRVGKGKALLSGVHFEISPDFCKARKDIYEPLVKHESQREQLFLKLLHLLID